MHGHRPAASGSERRAVHGRCTKAGERVGRSGVREEHVGPDEGRLDRLAAGGGWPGMALSPHQLQPLVSRPEPARQHVRRLTAAKSRRAIGETDDNDG
jgi:hypothetical protein